MFPGLARDVNTAIRTLADGYIEAIAEHAQKCLDALRICLESPADRDTTQVGTFDDYALLGIAPELFDD
jgi:hypothetical protein